jgi:hypothetical protein
LNSSQKANVVCAPLNCISTISLDVGAFSEVVVVEDWGGFNTPHADMNNVNVRIRKIIKIVFFILINLSAKLYFISRQNVPI